MRSVWAILLLLLAVANAADIANNKNSKNKKSKYDYIVIGAGSAGSIVAERLSQNYNVLVLDSGQDYTGSFLTTPSLYKSLSPPPIDHLELVDHVLTYEYPHGTSLKSFITRYALGGASAMNGNFMQRVSEQDLKLWSQIVQDPLWTWANTLGDFQALENWNSSDPYGVHGVGGPVTIQTFAERKVMIHDMLLGGLSALTGLPILPDSNAGTIEGVSLGARTIAAGPDPLGEGVRQDLYSSVLKPKLNRKTLTLKSGCRATRIKFDVNDNDDDDDNDKKKKKTPKPPRATKVQFICDGQSDEEEANKEIILCAGVFASPQLLMLSGIGDASHLQEKGIPVVYNNTHVGQHLKGNIGNTMAFMYPGAAYGLPPLNLPNGIVLTVNYKSNPSLDRPDMEISINCFRPDQSPLVPSDSCAAVVIQNIVDQEGSITLKSKNPIDMPNITYALFKDPFKVAPMVDGLDKVRSLFGTLSLPFIEILPGPQLLPTTASFSDKLTYIVRSSQAEWHDVGTCSMGKVVDSRLRVKGVRGLRVIDQSVVPVAYSGHTAASGAVLVGAVGARLILEDA
jgi:choline dehydrogenase